jgi:cytidylate kinase
VRARLVELQRLQVGDDNVVTEGRDQGSVVFPHAACKIFLTASPEERARRRMNDLEAAGEHPNVDDVRRQIEERDRRDETRAASPLRPASDAVIIDTDKLGVEDVVTQITALATN